MCHTQASAFQAAQGVARDRVLQAAQGVAKWPSIFDDLHLHGKLLALCCSRCRRQASTSQASQEVAGNPSIHGESAMCGFMLDLPMCRLALSMLHKCRVGCFVVCTHMVCREARGPHRYVEDVHGSGSGLAGKVRHLLGASGLARKQRRHGFHYVQGIQPCSTLPQS